MSLEPPPQVKEFDWIWTKWIYHFWASIKDYIDGVLCAAYCLKDYKEVVATNAPATGTVSLDLNDGNIHEVTLTGNTTFTFDNPVASGKASNLTITLSQDSHGSHTTTWPSSVKWAGGTAPTLTTTANAVNVLTFYTMDNGITWYGFLSGADMS